MSTGHNNDILNICARKWKSIRRIIKKDFHVKDNELPKNDHADVEGGQKFSGMKER